MGTSHFGNEKLVTKTTVVVGKDGSAHAESFIETIPVSSNGLHTLLGRHFVSIFTEVDLARHLHNNDKISKC